jgi:hypothetical protein
MYKDYNNIRQDGDGWVATVYEYADSSMSGHPNRVYTESVDAPEPQLPDFKTFDTGYVHLQFDVASQEYKDFCADPRTSEFLNNQTVSMSYVGIQFRKSLIAVLETETVLSNETAASINALLDSWASELKQPS